MCERNALTTVSFPFIVKLYYAFQNEWKCFVCFLFFCFEVFDVFFFSGGDLFTKHEEKWHNTNIKAYSFLCLNCDLSSHTFIIINAWWWRWNHVKHSLTDFCLSKRYSLEDEEIKNNKSYGYWSWLLVSCHSCLWNGLQVRRESILVFVDSNLVSLIKGLLNKRSKRNILI